MLKTKDRSFINNVPVVKIIICKRIELKKPYEFLKCLIDKILLDRNKSTTINSVGRPKYKIVASNNIVIDNLVEYLDIMHKKMVIKPLTNNKKIKLDKPSLFTSKAIN